MLSITFMMLILGGIIPVHAAPGDLLLTINNPTPELHDFFSYRSIAVTTDGHILVGTLYDNTNDRDAGTVYLFDGINGNLLLEINNPTPEPGDQFGGSIAVTTDGNILIGTPNDRIYLDGHGLVSVGSVYLFDGTLRGTTSTPLLTINNPTPEIRDSFGDSVAGTANGNLLVGAFYDNTGDNNAGSVYLFDGTDGSLLLEINNPAAEYSDWFGRSVAGTANGNLLVGSYYDNTGADTAGSVYLFDGNDGSLLLEINNPTPEPGDQFGYSVTTTSTGNLLIGAYAAGSVYLFDENDGSLLLEINNPAPEDYFGFSVAGGVNGNILVGASGASTNVDHAGSVYLFDGTTGSLLLTINNPTPESGDAFGLSVRVTATGDLLVSAYSDDTGAINSGSVYLFEGISASTPVPTITSLVADDPDDLDNIYSINDSITITFDSDTNEPGGTVIQNRTAVDNLFTFTESLGEAYTGLWNSTVTFVITISNTTGAAPPIINYTTVTPAGITPILSADETSESSTVTSPVLSGDFGLASVPNTGDHLLTINNPLSETDDNFGKSIATTFDGDIVVGLRYNDVDGINAAGSVGVFNGTTGELILLIDNPIPEPNDNFGSDVEVTPDGNILVSAVDGYNGLGKVYLFNGTTGELLLSIENNTEVSNNGDNLAVTPDGNIVIGSVYDDTGAGDAGSVYLFDGTSGEMLLTINNPTPNTSGLFGSSVASTSTGDLLISTGGTDEINAVYLFNGTSGEMLLTINNPDSSIWRPSIAILPNDNFVIGDRYDEFIYLFNGTTGELLLTIESPDVYNSIHLGWDITITSDGNIFASTEFHEQPNSYENGIGLAHLFNGTTGELLLSIESPNDMIAAGSPQTAVTNNGKFIVSVPYHNEFMFFSPEPRFLGEVYAFEGILP